MKTNKAQNLHVVAVTKKARHQLSQLIGLIDQMNDFGLGIFADTVDDLAGKYPRYPVSVSVPTDGLRFDAVRSLLIAELVSNEGMQEMLKRALRMVTDYNGRYARRPNSSAIVFNLNQGAKS